MVGHKRAVRLLQASIVGSRVSHAYLLSGPRQIGKTTLALTFARAINCLSSQTPCGDCGPCRRIAKGTHPDVRLLRLGSGDAQAGASTARRGRDDAERSKRGRVKNIAIEEVRSLLRDVVLAPFEGRWKVYVVRYAEDLSSEAMQALLKTIEEPPAHVILTLITVDAKILPLTVVSRCQQVSLGLVPVVEIEQVLRDRHGASEEQAKLLAHLSCGRVGWAIEALRKPAMIGARSERLNSFLETLTAGRVERLAHAEQLATEFGRDPEAATVALELWLTWWRDLLLTKNGAVHRVVNEDRQQELREHAGRFQLEQLVGIMQEIRSTLRRLHQNVNPRLAYEVLMLNVPSGAR